MPPHPAPPPAAPAGPLAELNAGLRAFGLWGAFPWATAATAVCAGGMALSGWPRAPFVGWLVLAVGWTLLAFLGLGGVVSSPWWRAVGGMALGEAAAASVAGAHLAGLVAVWAPGFGVPEAVALAAALLATGLAGAWASVRWGAGPLGALAGVAWAAALSLLPIGLTAIVYGVLGPDAPR